jgi:hypothetical protein
MPWTCNIVTEYSHAKKPGDMWKAENNHWWVVLPNGGIHDINSVFPDGSTWTVTGEAPKLTVTPSIRRFDISDGKGGIWKKGWHGYITDGILTDDYDGRTYTEEERERW